MQKMLKLGGSSVDHWEADFSALGSTIVTRASTVET
jgi:hypothetical protein